MVFIFELSPGAHIPKRTLADAPGGNTPRQRKDRLLAAQGTFSCRSRRHDGLASAPELSPSRGCRPSVTQAFASLVQRGARAVVIGRVDVGHG